jgi:tRNA 5-methylaminomethyl-2-thiouridine biosynthesis bifunctional protein
VELKAADIEWRQGSPYSLDYEDFYWSPVNGLEESSHVFLQHNNLHSRWQKLSSEAQSFSVGELGFGAGLNFLNCCELWLKTASDNCTLHYFSAESSPLTKDDLAKILQQWPSLSTHSQMLIDHYPPTVKGFHNIELYGGRINLCLMLGDAQEMFSALGESIDQRNSTYNKKPIDAWFLDGFSPEKNPSMWQPELCKIIAGLSSSKTTLTTYSAASQVGKSLIAAGFSVDYLDGFAEKRQIISAMLNAGLNDYPTRARGANQWHLNQSPNRPLNNQPSVAIIGAGIAGCTTAAALSKRGYKITIIDRHATAGQEASGNQQAIIYPKLSVRDDSLPRINLAAITLASRYYRTFWERGLGQQCGVLVLPDSDNQRHQFELLGQHLSHQQSLVRLVNNSQMKSISGLTLDSAQGLYFPQLGWLPPAMVCQELLEDLSIPLIKGDVDRLFRNPKSGQWELFDEQEKCLMQSDIVVIANAHDCEKFKQTDFLNIQKLRGQVTELPVTSTSKNLQTVICGEGYIAPPNNASHGCGATYNKGIDSRELRIQDHQTNLDQIIKTDQGIGRALGDVKLHELDGRANFRCTTRDYLPIVGPVPDVASMLETYQFLRIDARKDSSAMGIYHPNLYVNCGMGSRGLGYAPLTAEVLAAEIHQQLGPIERELRQAMHPSRFLIRDLKKKRI